jgi:hypothetical protein
MRSPKDWVVRHAACVPVRTLRWTVAEALLLLLLRDILDVVLVAGMAWGPRRRPVSSGGKPEVSPPAVCSGFMANTGKSRDMGD